ncbi:MAG: hypothetical protein AB1813_24955 [Verrucomicrobiota bacterium]
MKIWKVILAVALIFGSGLVTGAVLMRLKVNRQLAASSRPPSDDPVRMWMQQRKEILQKMERYLDLTPAQRDRIERLMKISQDRLEELWEPLAPRVREESRTLRRRIEAELTPDQQQKFHQLFPSRREGRARE